MKTTSLLENILAEHDCLVRDAAEPRNVENLSRAAAAIVRVLKHGRKILVCGNGGSAADSIHFAAEMVGRFEMERDGYPFIALSANPSVTTSVGNDYSFDEIFARQVRALGKKGDALIAISTSGASRNVLRAAETAREREMTVLALTGKTPNPLAESCSVCLAVPSASAARVQEIHILFIHVLSRLIEEALGHE